MIAAAVVDASVAVKWVVEEPDSGRAGLLAGAKLEAPDLLWTECANILWKKTRIGDLTAQGAEERLAVLLQAPVLLLGSRELLPRALGLSIELAHPVYDCLYIAAALARRTPLVTADDGLVRAARRRRSLAAAVLHLSDLSP